MKSRLPDLSALAPLIASLDTANQAQQLGRTLRERANVAKWDRENPAKRNALTAKRRAAKLQRTPPWADLKAIEAIYTRAQLLGEHVDHVIPLQGAYVSGLHVAENLQCLPASENSRKSNKFDVS